ncbi:hypothetical protein [Tumebacillus algifaecis]|uniref:hypothetical protein n=1 Tax=Tumebacillus algifaecis TaxID=1214604 RepID=UPI0012FDF1E9|nr:hypothetical protein [Tumebacillus algifaecis]
MLTKTRITLLVVSIVLILIGSWIYQQQNNTTIAVYQPLQTDGSNIDTSLPKPLLSRMPIQKIQSNAKLGMTEQEVEALFGTEHTETEPKPNTNQVWRYEFDQSYQLYIEWVAPNVSGKIEFSFQNQNGDVVRQTLVPTP